MRASAKSNSKARESANGLADLPCLSIARRLELRHVQKLLHRNFSLQFGKTPSEASVFPGTEGDIVLVAALKIEHRRSYKRRWIAVCRSEQQQNAIARPDCSAADDALLAGYTHHPLNRTLESSDLCDNASRQ